MRWLYLLTFRITWFRRYNSAQSKLSNSTRGIFLILVCEACEEGERLLPLKSLAPWFLNYGFSSLIWRGRCLGFEGSKLANEVMKSKKRKEKKTWFESLKQLTQNAQLANDWAIALVSVLFMSLNFSFLNLFTRFRLLSTDSQKYSYSLSKGLDGFVPSLKFLLCPEQREWGRKISYCFNIRRNAFYWVSDVF